MFVGSCLLFVAFLFFDVVCDLSFVVCSIWFGMFVVLVGWRLLVVGYL